MNTCTTTPHSEPPSSLIILKIFSNAPSKTTIFWISCTHKTLRVTDYVHSVNQEPTMETKIKSTSFYKDKKKILLQEEETHLSFTSQVCK